MKCEEKLEIGLRPAEMRVFRDRARFRVLVAGRRWGLGQVAALQVFFHSFVDVEQIDLDGKTRSVCQCSRGELADAGAVERGSWCS